MQFLLFGSKTLPSNINDNSCTCEVMLVSVTAIVMWEID